MIRNQDELSKFVKHNIYGNNLVIGMGRLYIKLDENASKNLNENNDILSFSKISMVIFFLIITLKI